MGRWAGCCWSATRRCGTSSCWRRPAAWCRAALARPRCEGSSTRRRGPGRTWCPTSGAPSATGEWRLPTRVAVLAARSVVAFAGYLAAVRLGATVVPLNPTYPARRNHSMCELAAVDMVLADESGAPQLDGEHRGSFPAQALCLTDAEALGLADAGGLPAPDAALEAVGYILFTSGSGG